MFNIALSIFWKFITQDSLSVEDGQNFRVDLLEYIYFLLYLLIKVCLVLFVLSLVTVRIEKYWKNEEVTVKVKKIQFFHKIFKIHKGALVICLVALQDSL